MYTEKEIAELKKYAVKHICPHYAVNQDMDRDPKVYVKSEGNYVFDIEGRKYLDTFGSLLTTVCGHNNMEIIDAIYEQIKVLDFFPNFGDHYCLPMVELAKLLETIAPEGLSAYFFVNSGSEANETALKIARSYHVERGESKRYKVVSRHGSYHGTTLAVTAATGLPWFGEKYTPMSNPGMLKAPAADCAHCELHENCKTCGLKCLEAMEQLIVENDPETISAVIMDPLPGSNSGYPVAPDGYLQGVRELCDKYGILLIFDEIQTGFGKSGEWFVAQHFGVTPDILTASKAISNGYIPLGVTMMRQDIYELFRSAPGKELRSGSTFGGHNVACAAAIATIRYIQKNDLLAHGRAISEYIQKKVHGLMEKYPFLYRLSGVGLLMAIELSAERGRFCPFENPGEIGGFINRYCYEHGMIIRNNCYQQADIIVIAPPLSFTEIEVNEMVAGLDQALAAAQETFSIDI